MAFDFSGKKFLVTGAGRGVGRGIALALARSGAKVYALARNKQHLDALAAENANIVPIVQDLSVWADTKATLEKLEPLDGLVNNAAVYESAPALEQSKGSIDWLLSVNLYGAINCIQVIGKKMVDEGIKGSIVNISSIGSQGAFVGVDAGYTVGAERQSRDVIAVGVLTWVSTLAIPSVASASLVTILILLTAIKIPGESAGMLFALEFLLDRVRSDVNIITQLTGVVTVQRFCAAALPAIEPEVATDALTSRDKENDAVAGEETKVVPSDDSYDAPYVTKDTETAGQYHSLDCRL